MSFYCIYTREDASVQLLKKSCAEKDVNFIGLDPAAYDYTTRPSFTPRDILYRVSTTKACADLEKFLLLDSRVTTFYASHDRATSSLANILMYEKENVPRPKTIYRLSKDKKLLSKYAAHLGLPLVIKALGGSHGVGVLKVDSLSSLFSIADYLLSRDVPSSFVMKEFIKTTTSARLIILGGEVIDSIKYSAPKGDFRSNEGDSPNVSMERFSPAVVAAATDAARALKVEFAGVDILIDRYGRPYVAEVNFPCFFPRCQLLTGTNISGMMIDYLIRKSKNGGSCASL